MVLLGGGRDPGTLTAALALTRRGPMNDLYAKLTPFAPQTASLRNIAVGVSRRDGAQASSARTNRGGIANTLASKP